MKIVFVGAGNLATHLAPVLCRAGHKAVQVFSRTQASASKLAGLLGTQSTTVLEEVCCDADAYVISVKDDALPELVARLCGKCGDALFIHTAGSVPMDVFKGHAKRYGVIYPMQSFSKNRPLDLSHVPFYIEANSDAALGVVRTLAESVSDRVRVLSSADRRYLHLAAVFACNFVNCCYNLASDTVEAVGIPFSDFLPLIDETAAKVHVLTPHEAQTGPAVRYDQTVIGRQVALLDGHPDVRRVYEALTDTIHNLHKEKP